MADWDFLVNVIVALGVGGVVGIEREHRGDRARVIAGVRTFPLVSLAGLLAVRLSTDLASPLPVAVGFGVAGGLALALFAARHSLGETGLTTPTAMVVTFLAGALIGFNLRIEGMVVGVATAALLVSKKRLHSLAHHLSDEEVMSTVQFITLAFILLPLTFALAGPFDPWGLVGRGLLLDPYWVLLIVVFVSTLSFVSFLAMRMVGATRGVEVSGLLGGLVNSEATTASLAAHAREDALLERPAIVGTLLATATMFARNLAIAGFVDPSLQVARLMVPALGAMAVATLAVALLRERRVEGPTPGVRIGNPFALAPAVKFAAMFLSISVLAYGAQQLLGPWGVYASLVGALVSGGAVVASVGTLAAAGAVPVFDAGMVAVLACVLGVLNKPLILRATHEGMFRRSARAYAVTTAVGLMALAATWSVWSPPANL